MPLTHQTIRHGFRQARQSTQSRHRDIAQTLGICEGELVASHCGPFEAADSPMKARRLRAEWAQIVGALAPLGELLALTRNDSCVHETVGTYRAAGVGASGAVGAIDLRPFYGQWAHGFAVEERLHNGPLQRSLQFFDAHGHAVHQVFLREASVLDAYFALVDRFAAEALAPGLTVLPARPRRVEAPDAEIDVMRFREAWASMRDEHELFALQQRFGASHMQSLRLASPAFVQPVPAASAHEVMTRAAQEGVPIMVFVGNPGTVQVHGGTVKRVEVTGPWLRVLDRGFSLHLREDHIASAFLVKKPSSDGLVHSLELFDAAGGTIATLFGERKPGQAERCDWRDLLASLSPEVEACAA